MGQNILLSQNVRVMVKELKGLQSLPDGLPLAKWEALDIKMNIVMYYSQFSKIRIHKSILI